MLLQMGINNVLVNVNRPLNIQYGCSHWDEEKEPKKNKNCLTIQNKWQEEDKRQVNKQEMFKNRSENQTLKKGIIETFRKKKKKMMLPVSIAYNLIERWVFMWQIVHMMKHMLFVICVDKMT